MADFVSLIVAVAMGIIALAILAYDLFMRRRIMQSEIDLQEKKFKREEEDRAEWQN